MFVNVLRAHQAKALRSSVLWVELGLLAAVTALLSVLINTVAELRLDAATTMAGQLADMLEHTGTSTMGHLLAVVLAGAVLANDYGWRCVHVWLGRGVSRSTFLWTKMLSVLLPTALFFLVTALVTGTIAAAFTQADYGTVGPLVSELGGLIGTAALGLFAVAPFAALALLLAVVGRSMLVAVGGGMAITLIAETLVIQMLAMAGGRLVEAAAYLPGALTQALLEVEVEGAPYTLLAPGTAAVLIAVYTFAFLGLATFLFRRQDLSD